MPGSGWASKEFRDLCQTSEELFAGDEEDENKIPVGLATLAKAYDWKGYLCLTIFCNSKAC